MKSSKRWEEKIIALRTVSDDSMLDKYRLEELIPFIKEFFDDLGNSFRKAPLTIKHLILSSIFEENVAWGYPGISNYKISAVYQRIQQFADTGVSFSTPEGIRTPDSLAENQLS